MIRRLTFHIVAASLPSRPSSLAPLSGPSLGGCRHSSAGETKHAAATAATRPTWDKGRDRFLKFLSGWRPPYFLPMQYSD